MGVRNLQIHRDTRATRFAKKTVVLVDLAKKDSDCSKDEKCLGGKCKSTSCGGIICEQKNPAGQTCSECGGTDGCTCTVLCKEVIWNEDGTSTVTDCTPKDDGTCPSNCYSDAQCCDSRCCSSNQFCSNGNCKECNSSNRIGDPIGKCDGIPCGGISACDVPCGIRPQADKDCFQHFSPDSSSYWFIPISEPELLGISPSELATLNKKYGSYFTITNPFSTGQTGPQKNQYIKLVTVTQTQKKEKQEAQIFRFQAIKCCNDINESLSGNGEKVCRVVIMNKYAKSQNPKWCILLCSYTYSISPKKVLTSDPCICSEGMTQEIYYLDQPTNTKLCYSYQEGSKRIYAVITTDYQSTHQELICKDCDASDCGPSCACDNSLGLCFPTSSGAKWSCCGSPGAKNPTCCGAHGNYNPNASPGDECECDLHYYGDKCQNFTNCVPNEKEKEYCKKQTSPPTECILCKMMWPSPLPGPIYSCYDQKTKESCMDPGGVISVGDCCTWIGPGAGPGPACSPSPSQCMEPGGEPGDVFKYYNCVSDPSDSCVHECQSSGRCKKL